MNAGRQYRVSCWRGAYCSLGGKALAALVLLAGIVGASGCGVTHVRLNQGYREYVAADYPTVLKTWTRTGQLVSIEQADEVLAVTATFESYDFRWAYVVRYAQDYRLSIEQRSNLLHATLAETRKYHQFYVALYGSTWRWTDLTKPESGWVVRLIDDIGNETAPTEILPVRRPGALESAYFPYTSPWRRVFRIRFPVESISEQPTISTKAKWIGLRFAGVQGSLELLWHLDWDYLRRGNSSNETLPAPRPSSGSEVRSL